MSAPYKKFVEKRLCSRYLYYLFDDIRQEYRYNRGDIRSKSGMRHVDKTFDESVVYIDEVFEDYKKYSDVSSLNGVVAELGPGDNIGVALRLLAGGAETVHLVDRFFADRNLENNAKITRHYFSSCPELVDRFGDLDRRQDGELEDLSLIFGDALVRFHGSDASGEKYFFSRGDTYDWIISRSVLEHLYDPLMALQGMAKALKRGGRMIHKVDLRDHGMFSVLSHELKFLELPRLIYRRMSTASGRPNRVLIGSYIDALGAMDLDYRVLVTRLVGAGEIRPHIEFEDIPLPTRAESSDRVEQVKARLSADFRNKPVEELMVSGFMLIATKH